MSVTCVAKYSCAEEALVAQSKLSFYGIPCWFVEEHAVRMKWVYLQGAAGCHIEVPSSYADDACFLLNSSEPISDYDAYDPETETKRFWLMALVVAFSLGHIGLIYVVDHVWHWVKGKFLFR